MKQNLNRTITNLKRPLYFLATLGFVFGSASGIAMAAASGGQVQARSIKMSDNGASGTSITTGVGSGTNVTYRVGFTASSTYTVKGFVVDFCSGTVGNPGTPFIGDSTCGAPTNFSVGGSTPVVDTSAYTDNSTGTPIAFNAIGTSGAWTTGSLNSNQTFYMTNSTGVSITAGQKYSFSISGLTNPSDLGTFYARLVTFTTTTGASGYTHGFSTAYQDYGGFALSTAQIVQVTAKVQESLVFCVSGYSAAAFAANASTAPGVPPTSCSDTTAPAIILGHGTNNTLDTSQVDTNQVWSIVSTNALYGVQVRMHNANGSCGGLSLDAGTTCGIPPTGGGSATPATITVGGPASFGLECEDSTGGTGTVACDGNYHDGTTTHYAMDSTTSGDNVTTTYGDQVAASTAPIANVTNKYTFAAIAAATTPAGIYTANIGMIATGTF